MKTRTIEAVLAPPAAHPVGEGFRVHNFFPNGYRLGTRRMSPFFLLDYNAKTKIAPSVEKKGIGSHPHRGFETVTLAYHGRIAHHDSAGNSGIVGPGEVQWMTAGAGILHKEFQEENFSREGGFMQMVQLWVNLPAKDKMATPGYQSLTKENIGAVTLPNEAGSVSVVAGSYEGVTGGAKTFTPLHVYNAYLNAGGTLFVSFPEAYNTGFLVIEGSIQVNGTTEVPTNHFVLFKNDGSDVQVEALEKSTVLMLSGEPIEEPIVQYGPFVMNTQAEIQQAILDFNHGGFGELH